MSTDSLGKKQHKHFQSTALSKRHFFKFQGFQISGGIVTIRCKVYFINGIAISENFKRL